MTFLCAVKMQDVTSFLHHLFNSSHSRGFLIFFLLWEKMLNSFIFFIKIQFYIWRESPNKIELNCWCNSIYLSNSDSLVLVSPDNLKTPHLVGWSAKWPTDTSRSRSSLGSSPRMLCRNRRPLSTNIIDFQSIISGVFRFPGFPAWATDVVSRSWWSQRGSKWAGKEQTAEGGT